MNFFKQGVRWNVLGHGTMHFVLRLGAIGFAFVSALSVFWFYAQEIDDAWWLHAYQGMTMCFIILGYFAMRNLSHRMKDKKKVGSYVWVVSLYLYVEVICNLDHALVHYPAIRFVGLAAVVFSYMKLSVLAIMPIFGVVLAFVDVDMLIERGLASAQAGLGRVSGGNSLQVPQPRVPASSVPTSLSSPTGVQSSYPPAAPPKKPNGLGQWFAGGGPAQQAAQGQPQPQMATNGNRYGP